MTRESRRQANSSFCYARDLFLLKTFKAFSSVTTCTNFPRFADSFNASNFIGSIASVFNCL